MMPIGNNMKPISNIKMPIDIKELEIPINFHAKKKRGLKPRTIKIQEID